MPHDVCAPVLWDGDDNFLNGKLIGVMYNAIVVGPVLKPSGYSVPPYPGNMVNTLFVKDNNYPRGLYLNWTLDQWREAISATQVSPNVEKTYSVTIVGTPPDNITSTDLYNATINSVTQNGIDVDMSTIGYVSNSNGTGTITGLTIGPGDTIQVLYHTN